MPLKAFVARQCRTRSSEFLHKVCSNLSWGHVTTSACIVRTCVPTRCYSAIASWCVHVAVRKKNIVHFLVPGLLCTACPDTISATRSLDHRGRLIGTRFRHKVWHKVRHKIELSWTDRLRRYTEQLEGDAIRYTKNNQLLYYTGDAVLKTISFFTTGVTLY